MAEVEAEEEELEGECQHAGGASGPLFPACESRFGSLRFLGLVTLL